jgi:hypothetical protein
MNPISKAVSDLYFRIPKAIINEVFKPYVSNFRREMVSTSEIITNLVVRNRVLVDCNLVGGTEVNIDLTGVPVERISTNELIYYIPKDKTQGRSIVSALSVSNMPNTTAGLINGLALGNDIINAGRAMMMSHSSAPYLTSAKVELVAENTILIVEDISLGFYTFLRCVIEDDENLSGLNRRAYLTFAKLVELAVKSYIYNATVVELDQGQLVMGKELGAYKTIIDGYSEAETMYQDYLINQWSATAFLNDATQTTRYIKMLIGPYK